MKHAPDKRRHLEFDRKWKLALLTIVSFLVVILVLPMTVDDKPYMKWLSIGFFGLCGVVFLHRLLNPKTIFVQDEPERYGQFLEEEWIAQKDDPGLFTYSEQGFAFKDSEQRFACKWADIETIFGYLKDLDEEGSLMLDIFTTTQSKFKVSETTEGWFLFNKKLREKYQFVHRNWEDEVLDPDSAEKRKLVFDKKHRAQQKAEADCYKS
jgi:hypothetical protein